MTGPGTTERAAAPATRADAVSTTLTAKVGLLLPTLRAEMTRLWTAAPVADRYVEYLVVMHGVIRASVPLMRTARTRCAELAGTGRMADPVVDPLADYLTRHIGEETGHDEWVRQDLAALGADPDEPLRRIPCPTVAGLVGAQYYWIAHMHPVVLLGYVWVLEGFPPTPEFVDALRRRTGWPAAAFRTLRAHGALDPTHRRELGELLDRLPLTPTLRTGIETNALFTVGQLATLFRQLSTCPLPGRRPPT
ncbi:MAG TPA: iron-containing redox enzyme family protein [Mycobacteriales bacterium]